MKLIIDIPEEIMEYIKNNVVYIDEIANAIKNGTPLPKGHGDLKDMDDIYEALEGWNDDTGWIVDAIDCHAPTIIEADKECEEK